MALPNFVQVVFKQRCIVGRVSLRPIMHVHQFHLSKRMQTNVQIAVLVYSPLVASMVTDVLLQLPGFKLESLKIKLTKYLIITIHLKGKKNKILKHVLLDKYGMSGNVNVYNNIYVVNHTHSDSNQGTKVFNNYVYGPNNTALCRRMPYTHYI
jgi:hypothetical protein